MLPEPVNTDASPRVKSRNVLFIVSDENSERTRGAADARLPTAVDYVSAADR